MSTLSKRLRSFRWFEDHDPAALVSVAMHAELGVIHRDRRIAELEAALREIAGTYDETPQTATKLCAALYAVSNLAAHVLDRK